MSKAKCPGQRLSTQLRGISAVVNGQERWAPPSRAAQGTPNEERYHEPHTTRSSPGSTRTAPSASHQDGGEKCATGAKQSRLRTRDNIVIGTWNVRTLKDEGKIHELIHEMNRSRWNLLGICKMCWKSIGETTTVEGHKVYYSGKKDLHTEGMGYLVHKDIANTVMECSPVSSRLITTLQHHNHPGRCPNN